MLHFAAPAAWALAGLLGVLIALHLWERRRRLVDVPSLLLWQDIPTATARSTRFVPDGLFAIRALALLLLVAGLAGPHWSSRPAGPGSARAVVVLDCSASMQAREGQTSRFELARRTARAYIAALPADTEVLVIAAGPQPAVGPPTTDHDEALRQLAAMEPTDAPAAIDAALAAAQRGAARPGRVARIALFTDLPADRLAPAWRRAVAVFPVGESDDNLSIDGIQIHQSRFDDPRTARAFVTVRNHAGGERHAVLRLALDGQVFSRQGFTLAGRSAAGFPVPGLPGAGVLEASLDVDDALAVDDHAAAVVRPARPLRLLAVTADATFADELRRVVAAAPNLSLEVVAPGAYTGSRGADLVLFHRVAPPLPADASSLYVAPTGATGPFPSEGAAGSASMSSAAIGHPALRDVRLDLPLGVTDVQILAAPAWSDSLISAVAEGREAPLVLAGDHDGHRHAALAFDLATQGMLRADHTDLLLLFLDLVDWLVPTVDDIRIVPTGSVEAIDGLPAQPRRIVDPRGRETTVAGDQVPLVDAALAGEYAVTADGAAVRVFANLADANESDIGRPPPRVVDGPALVTETAPVARRTGATTPIASVLYAAAATLLLIEWMLARQRA